MAGYAAGRVLWPLALVLLAAAAPASAQDGEAALRGFLANVTSLSAEFRQQVLDSRGQLQEESGGRVLMSRPGRFRWDYAEPYERTILADGRDIWLYEPDLMQATTRALDSAGLRDTPAALLTGEQGVLDRFAIERSWRQDGLDQVELSPRQPESDFSGLQLAFAGGELRRLELRDRLGQLTVIEFSALQLNPALADALFLFVVPPGVDVIGDGEL
jgi:outer membrane lipoprotein carrier protein